MMSLVSKTFILIVKLLAITSASVSNNRSLTTPVQSSTESSSTFASNVTDTTGCNQENDTLLRSTESYKTPGFDDLTTLQQNYMAVLSSKDSCRHFGTCRFVSLLPFRYRYCHCDDECNIFGDCCFDLHVVNKAFILPRQLICVPIEKKDGRVLAGILVIAKCPDKYKDLQIDMYCQQNLSTSGPFVGDRNGIIYKNRHCAECNNVTEYQLYTFRITSVRDKLLVPKYMTELNPLQQLSVLLSDPDTDYTILAPDGIDERPCLVYQQPSLNDTEDCKNYSINGAFTVDGAIYRNSFCKREDGLFGCIGAFLFAMTRYETYPLTIMFSFAKPDGNSCDDGQQETDGICSMSPTYTNYTRRLSFHLFSSMNLDLMFLRQVMATLIFSLMVENQTTVLKALCFNDTTDSSNNKFMVYVNLRILATLHSRRLITYKTRLDNFQWKADVRTTLNETVQIHTIESGKSSESSLADTPLMMVYRYRGNILDQMTRQGVLMNASVSPSICLKLLVNTVLIDSWLLIESISCFEKLIPRKTTWNTEFIVSVITYVGCSISVIALIVSMIISRKLGTSSTVPGNNMKNLSLALILSNILFMVGIGANDYQKVCYFVGIMLHYLWLVSFSFMSISVTCICHKLLQTTVKSPLGDRQQSRRMKVFTALGSFIPLVFILPSVLLDYFEVPKFSALYDETACFPTGVLTNAIFFAGPVILSIAINLVSLFIIISYISRHRINIGQIRKSNTFQEGKVYLRICTFSGIVWIITFLGAFYRSIYIDLISIVLCSLQGFTVALSNLTTKRTLRSFGSNAQEPVKMQVCRTDRQRTSE